MSTCIISFSSRENGNCTHIGRFIQTLINDSIFFDFSTFEIRSCGRCSYECFTSSGKCPYIRDMEHRLLDAVIESDITYFVIPNYQDYPCANFFTYNERKQGYFQGNRDLKDAYLSVPKRAVVVSNTNEENFRKVLSDHEGTYSEILFLSSKKYGVKCTQENLLDNERALSDIELFVKKSSFLNSY